MEPDPQIKTILVSGATRGLGLTIATSLAESGFRVVCLGRTLSDCLQKQIDLHQEMIAFRPVDFADPSALYPLSAELHKEFGTFYGLINNAAIGLDGVLATMHETDIATMLDVNVKAPILLTKYISRRMLARSTGRVINITSIIASTGYHGLSVYAATKAAMEGFTKSLSRELGKYQITVNAVAPGYMQTEMTEGIDDAGLDSITRRSPMKRLARTQSVAEMVLLLLGEAGNDITGSTLTIDVGNSA